MKKKQRKVIQMLMKKASSKKEKARLKKLMKPSKKTLKLNEQICVDAFCNPGCKGTIFQDDDIDLKEKYKNQKEMLSFITQTRKNMFKNRKTILEDNFYYKLGNKAQLKQEGALSGCSEGIKL